MIRRPPSATLSPYTTLFGSAAGGGEREPGHPTELKSDRSAPPRLDFVVARGRSATDEHGPAHELRPSRDRKPVVGTPPHEAKHRARLNVAARGHERRTHGDLQRP